MRALGDEEVTCFDIVHKFALFRGKKRGRNWGVKRVKTCPSPNKSQYKRY